MDVVIIEEAEPKTVIVSLNPNSGAKDQADLARELASQLEQQGLSVQVLTDIEQVKSTVTHLLATTPTDLKAVVAAGGDGTVSLLVNTLPAETPLAILPLGTENLLAKYLKLTADPIALARIIGKGRTVRLDAGSANGKLFLVMASCGFDADVVNRLHTNRKGHIHHWSYAKPILGAIRRYKYPTLTIREDGSEKTRHGKWLFVFNVPRYAMNLPFVIDANPTDKTLDVLTFRGGNLLRSLFYLGTVLIRQHRRWGFAKHCRMTRFRIEANEPVAYQLDGDPGGMLPLEIDVVPDRLRVFVPDDFELVNPDDPGV